MVIFTSTNLPAAAVDIYEEYKLQEQYQEILDMDDESLIDITPELEEELDSSNIDWVEEALVEESITDDSAIMDDVVEETIDGNVIDNPGELNEVEIETNEDLEISNNINEEEVIPPPTFKLYSNQLEEVIKIINENIVFSELSTDGIAQICEYFELDTDALSILEDTGLNLSESIPYAQLSCHYGISIDIVLEECSTNEKCNSVLREMDMFYTKLYNNLEENIANEFKLYILKGADIKSIKKAYALSETFNINMEELLSLNKNTNSDQFVSSYNNIKGLQEIADVGINYNTILDYAANNNIAESEMEDLINESLILEENLTTPEILTTTSSLPSDLPGENEIIPANQIKAPFAYDSENNEDINMSTGALTYSEPDVSIPGRNGLDLVISRKYDSANANLYTPKSQLTKIATDNSDLIVIEWGYEAYIDVLGNRIMIDELSQEFRTYFIYPMEKSEYNKFKIFLDNEVAKNPRIYNEGSYTVVYARKHHEYVESYGTYEYFNQFKVYESSLKENDVFTNPFNLGHGWSFNFSHIETQGDYKYLNLSDGGSYEINITSTAGDSNLKDYTLNDIRLERENGGHTGAYYTLYYKDGKREFFDSSGRIVAIKDRFDNAITFTYSTANGYPKVVIKDTLQRTITITRSNTSNPNQHLLTITLPTGELKYTIDNLKDFYGSDINGYALSQFEDQMGSKTKYSYNVVSGDFNAYVKGLDTYFNDFPTGHKIFHQSIGYGRLNVHFSKNRNIYLNLSTITYPTNLRTKYTYGIECHNLGKYGSQENFYISERKNQVIGQYNNIKKYSYAASFNRNTDYSGYPSYNPSLLPPNYTYTSTVEIDGVRKTYTFNNKHLETMSISDYTNKNAGGLLYFEVNEYVYNNDKLPTRITNKRYNPTSFFEVYDPYTKTGTEPGHIGTIIVRTYDSKRNILEEWSPLANGNTSAANNVYKTTYTYDSYYNLPLTKTYYQNSSTKIKEINTLDTTYKKVTKSELIVNDVNKKAQTDYGYDSYGNINNVKRYKDNFADYTETSSIYGNGADLTEIRNLKIKDVDNNYVESSSGYSNGTLVNKYEYNNMGLVKEHYNPNNKRTSYDYNNKGDLILVKNPDASTISYDIDYERNEIIVTDEEEYKTIHYYTSWGSLRGSSYLVGTAASGYMSKYYDDYFRPIYDYDGTDNKSLRTDYTYDKLSRLESKIISGPGINLKETYDYEIVRVGNSENHDYCQKITKTVWGETDSPTIVTTQYIDKMSNVRQEGKLVGTTEHLDTYTYDYIGNRLTEKLRYAAIKGLSYSSRWEYDYAGRVTKTYNADGGYMSTVYDALGNKVVETDFVGTATDYRYDNIGRLLEVTKPITTNSDQVSKSYYDQSGNITSTRVNNNAVGTSTTSTTWKRTDYGYNSRGWLEYATVYDGNSVDNVTKYTYDHLGNQTTVTTGMTSKTSTGNTTTYRYNRYGLQEIEDAMGQSELYRYSKFGKLLEKTDRNNNIFEYSYDAFGRIMTNKATHPDGTSVTESTTYTLTGNKKSESNPTTITSYKYDELGRLYQETSNSLTKTYTYYDSGNSRATFVLKNGSTTILSNSYTYDNQNRLKTVSQGGSLKATYNYDTNGNRASLIYGTGTTTGSAEYYQYNLANWLSKVENKRKSNNAILSAYEYTYYADGNQRTKSDHNGRITTYVYDGVGRLKSESENTGFNAAYLYDKSSNRTKLTVTGAKSYVVDYAYDENNRLTKDTKTQGDITTVNNYGYDNNGNQIAKMAEIYAPVGTNIDELGLDMSGEVCENDNNLITTETEMEGDITSVSNYVHDNNRNQLAKMSETDSLVGTNIAELGLDMGIEVYEDDNNLITTETEMEGDITTVSNYDHDNNVNQIAKMSETYALAGTNIAELGLDMSGEIYEYDGFNRLTRSITDGQDLSYTYRPDGLRNSKKTSDGVTTTHVWDGQNIVADMNGSTVISKYVRGINLIESVTGSTEKYYLYNGHGDVVQLANTSGAVLWNYDYDAFGNEREISGQDASTDLNPFRYCGEYFDKETDTIYLRARYYSPSIGRMLSEDSVKSIFQDMPNKQQLIIPASLNLYIYCINNPIIYVDPTGNVITQWDLANLSEYDVVEIGRLTYLWESDHKNRAQYHRRAETIRNKYRSSGIYGSSNGITKNGDFYSETSVSVKKVKYTETEYWASYVSTVEYFLPEPPGIVYIEGYSSPDMYGGSVNRKVLSTTIEYSYVPKNWEAVYSKYTSERIKSDYSLVEISYTFKNVTRYFYGSWLYLPEGVEVY